MNEHAIDAESQSALGSMETATGILRQEHKEILRALDLVEDAAGRLVRSENIPPYVLDDLVEFLRLFADHCHHSKEEDLLFPLLVRKGLPRTNGPIDAMLWEHVQGRGLIRQMSSAADKYREGGREAGLLWAKAARAYAKLLREHVQKEDNVLFRIAEQMLSSAEQLQMASEFALLDNETIGVGMHQRLYSLVDRLEIDMHSI